RKQIHDKSAAKNQSGMICSGEQTIFLYRVDEKDISHIKNLISSLEQNKNGTLHLSPEGLLFEDTLPAKDFEFNLKTEEDWNYSEKIGYKNHLYIVGGGHCALAFSKMMREMDFYIHLFEERAQLNTLEKNNFVHEKTIVKDYSELAQLIPPGENNYVVVMTFGYRTDDIAVRYLLDKSFKYFGLLGSKKKIEKMFEDYRNEGIDEELLNKIHSPIGIQIKSHTPEEIAVSIAAEIIKVKNDR
ncbi:MAG: XdhC family protein, partial [Bacteroidota bacterium]|nr:XdhC family protein [Bacteroidota bacterium]